LLQGFDVKNVDGLNNIIVVLNSEFNTTFRKDFTNEDYMLFMQNSKKSRIELDRYDYIKRIIFEFPQQRINDENIEIKIKTMALDEIEKYLQRYEVVFRTDNKLQINGMSIRAIPNGDSNKIEIITEPLLWGKNIKYICDIAGFIYTGDYRKIWCDVILDDYYMIVIDEIKLSSRCSIAGITRSTIRPAYFDYRGILFNTIVKDKIINGKEEKIESIHMAFEKSTDSDIPVFELIEKLHDYRVFYHAYAE
jgi:hypothetical protein